MVVFDCLEVLSVIIFRSVNSGLAAVVNYGFEILDSGIVGSG